MAPSSPPRRLHVVLIPGFGGFDVLGQLEYYAGVTAQFRDWQALRQCRHIVLHYFDNFPTAAVTTRARLLRDYLGKRITRGEFIPGDEVALVGHSTGGLDIRQLVLDLATASRQPLRYDGGQGRSSPVSPSDVLGMIKRVVFLSVPHWGTNIADWVRSHAPERKLIVNELRGSVAVSQVPILDRLQAWISTFAAGTSDLDFLLALRDALREAESDRSRDRMVTALAQEADSQLDLWLRHMTTDFSAIDDLAAAPPDGEPTSPAHFRPNVRAAEMENWKEIETLSYVTLGRRPFHFAPGRPAPTWELLKPWTCPELTAAQTPAGDTDCIYRIGYRACAGGPFKMPPPQFRGRPLSTKIETWDNDGIVNTASMLWPRGPMELVHADHMDIVGHFERVRTEPDGSGRVYQAYDLLKSDSGFTPADFAQVWKDAFDFCAGRRAANRSSAAAAR